MALEGWRGNPQLTLLGADRPHRLPIFSFLVRDRANVHYLQQAAQVKNYSPQQEELVLEIEHLNALLGKLRVLTLTTLLSANLKLDSQK